MSATANDVKHLFIHRGENQSMLIKVADVEFTIGVSSFNINRRNVTLSIRAPKSVSVTRTETLLSNQANGGAHGE